MKLQTNKTGSPRRRAFTLVETTLAVGIASFTLVTIMGLLPCGVQVFRSAMDMALEAQMAQGIVATISQTKYSELDKLPSRYYFDDTGNIVPEQSADGIYSANIALSKQTSMPDGYVNSKLTAVAITFSRRGQSTQAGVPANKTHIMYIDSSYHANSP